MQLMVHVTVVSVFVCVCVILCVMWETKTAKSTDWIELRSLLSEQTPPCVLKCGDLHSQTFIYMDTW